MSSAVYFDATPFSDELLTLIRKIESKQDLKVAKYMLKQRKRELNGKRNKAVRRLKDGF